MVRHTEGEPIGTSARLIKRLTPLLGLCINAKNRFDLARRPRNTNSRGLLIILSFSRVVAA